MTDLAWSFVVVFIAASTKAGSATKIPMTRVKGEIACFSCFAKNTQRINLNSNIPPRLTYENMTDIVDIIERAGMTVPLLANRCSDTVSTGTPNFYGADIHFCPNTDTQHGACVKFKGYYKGEAFVYRECWSRMWKDPRPYKHHLSGMCFDDEMVQQFMESQKNTICFCEDDLCNGASQITRRGVAVFLAALAVVLGQ